MKENKTAPLSRLTLYPLLPTVTLTITLPLSFRALPSAIYHYPAEFLSGTCTKPRWEVSGVMLVIYIARETLQESRSIRK